MQTLSQILVLLMQQPILWLEQGCESTLCTDYRSGIICSWIRKAYLKARKGEKLGSFWNTSMLRNYIATIWINTTGTLCVTAPNVQTHTQTFSKSPFSNSPIKVHHDAATDTSWSNTFYRSQIFQVRQIEGSILIRRGPNTWMNTTRGPCWRYMSRSAQSILISQCDGGGTKLICSLDRLCKSEN